MAGPYPRVAHGDNFSDGGTKDGTVVINGLEAGVEALETTVAGLGTAVDTWAQEPAGSICSMIYNTGTSSYPVRQTDRTDILGYWKGPVAPPTALHYALPGDDWKNEAP